MLTIDYYIHWLFALDNSSLALHFEAKKWQQLYDLNLGCSMYIDLWHNIDELIDFVILGKWYKLGVMVKVRVVRTRIQIVKVAMETTIKLWMVKVTMDM